MDHLPLWVQIGGFVALIVAQTAGFLWKLHTEANSIRDTITDHQAATNAEFANVRRETFDMIVGLRREFGETAAAIRQKVNEVELFCRDTFLRQESFYKANDETRIEIRALGDKMDIGFVRLNERIDEMRNGA